MLPSLPSLSYNHAGINGEHIFWNLRAPSPSARGVVVERLAWRARGPEIDPCASKDGILCLISPSQFFPHRSFKDNTIHGGLGLRRYYYLLTEVISNHVTELHFGHRKILTRFRTLVIYLLLCNSRHFVSAILFFYHREILAFSVDCKGKISDVCLTVL